MTTGRYTGHGTTGIAVTYCTAGNTGNTADTQILIRAIIADIDNNICYSGAICNIHVCHADKTADTAAAPTRVFCMVILNGIAGNRAVCKYTCRIVSAGRKADKTANAVAALTILFSFDYIAFIRVYDHIFNRCADRNAKNTNTFRIAVNFNIFDRICLSVIMRSKI